ncbi:PD-(D/E)XK motif protein [Rhizobium sp. KAs_5_22]|uniref:PD-(D/E)XK motif protein n=1 Tax=Ciceribacter selenitireducens TaxID=448181 RepID=UPI0004908409|nr:PD-(D/E)XK motif protein [Ciceribacter selenitireducens]PPJ47700.1 PD-(D/E)XK motif protein [Rhizobium sp. KAs_5_22]
MTSSSQLDDLWMRLSSMAGGQRQFRSMRAPDAGALDVHVAIRTTDGARCLLFDLPDPERTDAGFEAGGLRLTRVTLENGLGIALLLEDATRSDLFTTICSDVIGFANAADPIHALRLVMERLEAWRQFLRSVSGGLKREDAIGLIGELIVLEALLARDPGLLRTWRAPENGLHDFENAGHAIEVKTTLGPGWRVTVSTLDQLDVTGLEQLDLLLVRLFETAAGETLGRLIERVASLLTEETDKRALSNALLQRGLAPDDTHARGSLCVAVQQMTAYPVVADFPRLRRHDLPKAIIDARYVLDLAQLHEIARPAGPTIESFGGRA